MSVSVKIAVIFPSRGLLFSQTAEELLKNLKGYDYKIFFSHRRPIPKCFEEPTQRALEDDSITHLWFVEDDMKLPPDTLKRLLAKDKAVVTADYPVNKNGRGSVFKVMTSIIFCGTGCLLVKREVFNELKAPHFYSDRKWNIKNYDGFVKMRATTITNMEGYGLHDINFCMDLYKRGIPIHMINKTLAQRKLVKLGEAGTNDGAHEIEEWRTIKKDELLKQVKRWPIQETGDLVTVETDTGEVLTSSEHAKKMIKAGVGRNPPKREIVIDWNEDEVVDSPNNV